MLSTEMYETRCDELLHVYQTLFYPLNIKQIYHQSIIIERTSSDSIASYFSKIRIITDLASHHLSDLTEKENFKSNNVRNNFLRACGEKFSTLIESREASVGIRYTPQELFTTYKIYQDNERNEQKFAKGNSPHIYNL